MLVQSLAQPVVKREKATGSVAFREVFCFCRLKTSKLVTCTCQPADETRAALAVPITARVFFCDSV